MFLQVGKNLQGGRWRTAGTVGGITGAEGMKMLQMKFTE